MNSFGFWYKTKRNDYASAGEAINEGEPLFDLHINLWDFVDSDTGGFPCIDVGLKISHYDMVDRIAVYCPFSMNKDDVIDLSSTFSMDNPIANLVFNENCNIIGAYDRPRFIQLDSQDRLRLYEFKTLTDRDISPLEDGGTKVEFDIACLDKPISDNEQTDLLYIRFRICSKKIDAELFCDIEQKNLFLESAYEGIRIVDIKVNKLRNMNKTTLDVLEKQGMRFIRFRKLHFLLIEPVDSDVEFYGEGFSECRRIEPEWSSYLWPRERSHIVPDMLAYHWKSSYKEGEKGFIQEYSNTIKVRRSITNWSIIRRYIIVAVIIGVISSVIIELPSCICNIISKTNPEQSQNIQINTNEDVQTLSVHVDGRPNENHSS